MSQLKPYLNISDSRSRPEALHSGKRQQSMIDLTNGSHGSHGNQLRRDPWSWPIENKRFSMAGGAGDLPPHLRHFMVSHVTVTKTN